MLKLRLQLACRKLGPFGGKLQQCLHCLLCCCSCAVTENRQQGDRVVFDNRHGMELSLRHTLWQWKLGNVLVFETEEHINALRRRTDARNKPLNGYVLAEPATRKHRFSSAQQHGACISTQCTP